jgi:hypothetical protein
MKMLMPRLTAQYERHEVEVTLQADFDTALADAHTAALPVESDYRDFHELWTGRDMITEEELNGVEYGATAAAAFFPIVGGKALRALWRRLFKGGAKAAEPAVREGAEVLADQAEKSTKQAADAATKEANQAGKAAEGAAEKTEEAKNAAECLNADAASKARPSLTAVPSIRGGEFQKWFNELTSEEFNQVWSDPALRAQIEQRLRSPGGFHEWLPVSRAPVFKSWGVTAEQIHRLRTATRNVVFRNGRHGGPFSGTAHEQLFRLIDESPDYATYVKKLQAWANEYLEGGAAALPEGLRP